MSRPKVMSGWKLWRATLGDARQHWRSYAAVILVIELPLRLLSLSSGIAQNVTFLAYSSMLSLILNLALLASVIGFDRHEPLKLRAVYYDGTRSFVRYVLAVVLLALIVIIPASLSVIIFYVGVLTSASPIESWIFVALAVLIALPVVILLARFGFAVIDVVSDDAARPVGALAWSLKLTRGRLLLVTGRFIVLIFWLLVSALIVAVPVIIVGTVFHNDILLNSMYELLATLVVLPLGTIYLVKLASALGQAAHD